MVLIRTRRLFENGPCAEFHENPISRLISDARSDGRSKFACLKEQLVPLTLDIGTRWR